MLDRGRDQAAALGGGAGRPENRQIVRLGTAAGKDDVARSRADECGDPLARPLQLAPRLLSGAMDRRGIGVGSALDKCADSLADRRP